jgi:3'(2'), 5'-bisphosphate nucleotidase
MGGLCLSSWAAAPSPSSAAARGFRRSPSDWRGLRGRRGRSRCAPSSPPSASPALSLGAAGRLRVGADREWLWDCRGGGLGGGGGKKDYAKEMEAAVRVVQVACTLCQRVQDSLLLADPGSGSGGVHSKLDRSPVTVAGWYCHSEFYYLY